VAEQLILALLPPIRFMAAVRQASRRTRAAATVGNEAVRPAVLH
jgi:hypothetical protein